MRLWSAARTRSCASCVDPGRRRLRLGARSRPASAWIAGEHLGQCAMCRPLLRRGRRGQHRRTQQRMAEPELRAATHQHAVVLSLVQGGGNVHAVPGQRRRHRGRGAERLRADSSTARQAGADNPVSCCSYTIPRRSPTGSASGSGAAPTRWASVRRRAISRIPSGLPPVSSTKRSTTPSATRSGTRAGRRRRDRPARVRTGIPATNSGWDRAGPRRQHESTPRPRGGDEPRTRVPRPTPGRPTAGRRPAPASVSALTSAASSDSTAAATRKRSAGAAAGPHPRARDSAVAWAPGISPSSPAPARRPAAAPRAPAPTPIPTPRTHRHRKPVASCSAASSRVVFPMPGSPSTQQRGRRTRASGVEQSADPGEFVVATDDLAHRDGGFAPRERLRPGATVLERQVV